MKNKNIIFITIFFIMAGCLLQIPVGKTTDPPSNDIPYIIITSVYLNMTHLAHCRHLQTFQDLADYKSHHNTTAMVITKEKILLTPAYWQDLSPDGIYANEFDEQGKIRSFIRYAVTNWHTEYILLGGDIYQVPERRLFNWHGIIDYVLDSDVYYSCYNGSFNYNRSDPFGTTHDGTNGSDIDLEHYVAVGRALVSNPREVSYFVNKTIKYLNSSNSAINHALFIATQLDEANYSAPYKENIIHVSPPNYGIPERTEENPNGYFIQRIYDNISYKFTKYDIINDTNINNGLNFINCFSHGYWDNIHGYNGSSFKNEDTGLLTNDYPFFVFFVCCDTGIFGHLMYDPPYIIKDCIIENLTGRISHGAVAAIGWSLGLNILKYTTYDHEFWNQTFNPNSTHKEIGKSVAYLRSVLKNQNPRNEIYGFNYFGDPQLMIRKPITNHSPTKPILEQNNNHLYASSTDIDGNRISYKWKVDGQEDHLWTAYHSSGESIEYWKDFLLYGTHQIQIKARDTNLTESEWSDPATLTISYELNLNVVSQALMGETIQFNALASGGSQPYSLWNYGFDDGQISQQQQNLTHTYNASGTYNVTLSVRDQNNIYSNITKTVTILPLISEFETSLIYAIPNQTIVFTDNSRGYNTITNWTWDFDDGTYSYSCNLSHTFTIEGVYNVSLTVRDNCTNASTSYQNIFVDSHPPRILNTSENQLIIGYGSNTTLTATILDNISNVKIVKINISYPFTSTYQNITMSNVDNDNYTASFNDTWKIGRYNYTLWTLDNVDNGNSTPGSFFVDYIIGNSQVESQNMSIWDTLTGNKFTIHHGNSVANNITVYIDPGNATYNDHYQCVVYQHDDSALVGVTEQKSISGEKGWTTFNFSDPKPILVNNTEYVVTCWSDNMSVTMYYGNLTEEEMFFDDGTSTLQGHYFEGIYNTTPDPTRFEHENKIYSIYLSYTPDTTLPTISDFLATPTIVGFGNNVTINATITDLPSGVSNVTINITCPDSSTQNLTMNHTGNHNYTCLFTNTWKTGQYDFTIWTTDRVLNKNHTQGHFNVTATAHLSIATLKNSYTANEYINLTDPPEPPSNNTLIDRGLEWNKYYDPTLDKNILEISSGPIHYQNETNDWTPINTTLTPVEPDHPAYTYGYRIQNNRGLYSTYFKPSLQQNWPVAFAYNRSQNPTTYVLRTSITGVGYIDPSQNWRHVILQGVQNSQGQTNGNTITYPGAFNGVDVTYTYDNTLLKEEIHLSNATKAYLQAHPPASYGLSGNSYLVFATKLDLQSLTMHNGTMEITDNITIPHGGIDLKNALNRFACALPIGEAYEENHRENTRPLTYRIIRYNGEWYLLSGLPVSTLSLMTFPVVIDPSITLYSSSSDGHISASNTNYNTAWTASQGTISDTNTYFNIGQRKASGVPGTYYVYRGFLYFNTGPLQMSAVIDTVTLSLYKYSDSSTTDFLVTVQNGQPTYPDDPLKATDYDKSHYSGNGGQFNTNSFTTGYNNITLNSTGLGWINQSGWTRLCLRSSRDISGTTPTGSEYIGVYSSEQGSGYQPKLVITYRNQSKIKNTGTTDIKGYLLIQVQFQDPKSGQWMTENDTINETLQTIVHGQQLGLDTVYNGQAKTDDLQHGDGTYRVYTAFRDSEGNILVDSDQHQLVSTWQFSVSGL